MLFWPGWHPGQAVSARLLQLAFRPGCSAETPLAGMPWGFLFWGGGKDDGGEDGAGRPCRGTALQQERQKNDAVDQDKGAEQAHGLFLEGRLRAKNNFGF